LREMTMKRRRMALMTKKKRLMIVKYSISCDMWSEMSEDFLSMMIMTVLKVVYSMEKLLLC
jgi:hypothetical protein